MGATASQFAGPGVALVMGVVLALFVSALAEITAMGVISVAVTTVAVALTEVDAITVAVPVAVAVAVAVATVTDVTMQLAHSWDVPL